MGNNKTKQSSTIADVNPSYDTNINLSAEKDCNIWKVKQPFQAYKKVECKCKYGFKYVQALATLTVPINATVVRPLTDFSKKLRSDMVHVDSIEAINGENIDKSECRSLFMERFSYREGGNYQADVNLDKWKTCTYGLHFFLDKKNAVEFELGK